MAETAYRTRTVAVDSSDQGAALFHEDLRPRLLRDSGSQLASRRDVNLLLVLDRSSSMNNSGSCDPMKAAAQTFVEQFANGRDRLGLLTYGASYTSPFRRR